MKNRIEITETDQPIEEQNPADSLNLKNKFIDSISKFKDSDEADSFYSKFQPIAEKTAAIITVIDSVIDPFNDYAETQFSSNDILPIQLGCIEKVDECFDFSLNDILSEKGYYIKNDNNFIETVIETVGDIIQISGSDEDEALVSLEEIKQTIEEENDIATSENNTTYTGRNKEKPDDGPKTEIDNKVIEIKKQELPYNLVNTFKNGEYRTVKTTEDLTLYRVYGDCARKQGCFLTTQIPKDRLDTKMDSALLPKWNNSRKYYCEVEVPKGTIINIGKVAEKKTSDGNILSGGADQILVSQKFAANPEHYKQEHKLDFAGNYLEFEKKAKKFESR